MSANTLLAAAFYILSILRRFTIPALLLITPWTQAQSSVPQSNALPTSSLSALTQQSQTQHFLPVEAAYQLVPRLQNSDLLLQWKIADGYYLYGPKFKAAIIINGEERSLALQLPEGKLKHDEYFGDIVVFYETANLSTNLAAIATLPANADIALRITSQGCADAGLCYPPTLQYFRINLASAEVSAVDATEGGKLFAINPAKNPDSINKMKHSASASVGYWLTMMGAAFLGGIILNLMPCVFPVLSLKVLKFLRDEQHSHALHGISYSAGVIISFIAMASLLLGLREAGAAIGWGFQLQSPWFVGLMVYLFFVLALNLSGLFEIGGSWTNSGNKYAQAPGYGGSFATGLLATLVASPCTAPFMGAALGFAISQPASHALLVFICLGLGMATPVLVLSLSPALLKRLPKPGDWMEVFRQLLAFPLYATALWLAWVLGNQTDINGLMAILLGCLLLSFAAIIWPRGSVGKSSAAIAVALAIFLPFSSFIAETTATENTAASLAAAAHDGRSQQWSEARLAQLRSEGNAVFVNVTADWCITCLANEKLVLGSDEIKTTFAEKNIAYLKADWTRYDATITNYLAEFGRNGVPLYVFYPANHGEPVVLPQILRSEYVFNAINPEIKKN